MTTGLVRRHRRDPAPVLTFVTAASLLAVGALRVLGVPQLDIHGPLHHLGIMDPLCGGTRATFLLASGRVSEAAEYNPVVFPLAVAALWCTMRLLLGLSSRLWLQLRVPRRARWPLFGAFVASLVLLGIRQQLHAALLQQPWPGA